MRLLTLLLVIGGAAAGCDRSEPAPTGNRGASRTRGEANAPTGFERRLLFLPESSSIPLAAVFDFTVVLEPASHARIARMWLGRNGSWEPVFDAAWQAPPVREPWRLLPNGPLRLMVGERGELEALAYQRGSEELRLTPARALVDWSSGQEHQLRLRPGEILFAGSRARGLVLDEQRQQRAGSRPGTSYDAFLTDGQGLYLVFQGEAAEARSWRGARREGQTWAETRLEAGPSAPGAAAPPAASSAAVWRVVAPRARLQGELQLAGPRAVAWPADGGPELGSGSTAAGPAADPAGTLYFVRGWVRLGSNRRPLFGVIRHG
ncbi:MAG: hypothetical protein HY703_01890 [Gemmatimonadetes bacterium]|nr:hypothetical protein [Gemmatimonadota bacterium]